MELDWSTAARYLTDELSLEDRRQFEDWLDQDPQRLAEMAALQRLWNDAGALPSAARMQSVWSGIAARLPGAAADGPPARRNHLSEE